MYSYVTGAPDDGGLGIHPENDSWSRIESIMTLHDPEFNHRWIRSLTTSTTTVGHGQLDAIRTQVCFSSISTSKLYSISSALSSLASLLLSTLPFSPLTLVPSSLSPSLVSRIITSVKLTRFSILLFFSFGPSSSLNTGVFASAYIPLLGAVWAQFV